MSSSNRSAVSFTIIELLIMSIAITVLAALVVPATAHDIGRQRMTVCSRNLAHLAQGAIEYATWNDDWIVGSPSGSGEYLRRATVAHGPAVQTWDFLGPLDHMWNPDTPLPAPGDLNAVIDRFNVLRGKPEYLCPQNHFMAPSYGLPDAGIGPMVSYNTARYQLWTPEEVPWSHGVELPSWWRPSVSTIGSPQNKVFCADGARYSTTATPPDYELQPAAEFGGAFADPGAFSRFGASWDRGLAPGNGNPHGGDFEARLYAYRHGVTARNLNGDIICATFKMNLAFYDGHVELQDDMTSSNPQQWLPSGTLLESYECWSDTIAHFDLDPVITILD